MSIFIFFFDTLFRYVDCIDITKGGLWEDIFRDIKERAGNRCGAEKGKEVIKMQCSVCGKKNEDNWPTEVNGVIKDGGCQECWELQCDKAWWEEIMRLSLQGSSPISCSSYL